MFPTHIIYLVPSILRDPLKHFILAIWDQSFCPRSTVSHTCCPVNALIVMMAPRLFKVGLYKLISAPGCCVAILNLVGLDWQHNQIVQTKCDFLPWPFFQIKLFVRFFEFFSFLWVQFSSFIFFFTS